MRRCIAYAREAPLKETEPILPPGLLQTRLNKPKREEASVLHLETLASSHFLSESHSSCKPANFSETQSQYPPHSNDTTGNLFPLQSLFSLIAVAVSTIGPYTGITPLYGFGLLNGGAVGVVWGWVVVSFFMSFVALALAEICSSYPVSNGHPFVGDYKAGDLSAFSLLVSRS
jgi:hypothetical protein